MWNFYDSGSIAAIPVVGWRRAESPSIWLPHAIGSHCGPHCLMEANVDQSNYSRCLVCWHFHTFTPLFVSCLASGCTGHLQYHLRNAYLLCCTDQTQLVLDTLHLAVLSTGPLGSRRSRGNTDSYNVSKPTGEVWTFHRMVDSNLQHRADFCCMKMYSWECVCRIRAWS